MASSIMVIPVTPGENTSPKTKAATMSQIMTEIVAYGTAVVVEQSGEKGQGVSLT